MCSCSANFDFWMTVSYVLKQLLVCAPVGGSRAVGRQKHRWTTLYLETLQGVGCQKTGMRGQAQEMPGVGETKRNVEAINVQAEQEEKERKDRRKRLREQRHTDAEVSLHAITLGAPLWQ